MEQQQNAFGPCGKHILKGETYFSLLRLLSFCDDHPHLWQLKPGSNNGDEPEGKTCVQEGSNDGDCLAEKSKAHDPNFDCMDLDDIGFGETKVVIDEIECIMSVDEDEHQLMQNCSVVDKIMELGHVMKGNDNFGGDNNESPHEIVGEDTCLDIHPLGESRMDSEQTILGEGSISDVSKLLDLSSGESRDSKVLGASQEIGSELKEIITLEKPICVSNATDCPNSVIVGGEVEEGEIHVDSKVDERADLKSCKDDRMTQTIKLDEKKLSSDVIDEAGSRKQSATNATTGNQFPSSPRTKTNKDDSCSIFSTIDRVDNRHNGIGNKGQLDIPMVSNRKTVVYEDLFTEGQEMWQEGKKGERAKGQRIISENAGRNKGNRGGEVGNVKGQTEQNKGGVAKGDVRCAEMSVEKSSQDPSGSQVSACLDKDGSPCKNRKRGPLSDARKESRKRSKRKKRAELNKELGVKRLKLQPVVNQKPVGVCRHYMKGKCHEEEKCKFSHDAIPLTKSKPCVHFARDKCIKMDKCPYDHQLSKYPCDKYMSTGSCIRGNNCLFSHKDLPNGEVPTIDSVKPKSSVLTGNVGTKRKLDIVNNLNQNGKTAGVPAAVSSAKIQPFGWKNMLNASGVTLTGIAGKSLLGGSNCTPQGSSSVAASDTLNSNHTDQHSSGVAGKPNTTLKQTPPAAAPKGINFLSFGKSSLQLSAAKQSSVTPISRNDSLKLPLLNTSGPYKQVSDSGTSIQMGGFKQPSECNTIPKMNQMTQRTDHVTASPNHSSLLPRVASAGDCNRQAHLPSSSDGGISSTCKGNKTDINHSLNATTQGLPSSSSGSGQLSGHMALLQLKNVPNSTRKSLMSTLAFAAKVDSDMKKKQIGTESSNVLRTSNDHNQASRILDFMSSLSGKTK